MYKIVRRLQVVVLMLLVGLVSSGSSSASDVVVPVSRSVLIELPVEMGEVIVADPAIADVYVHGKNKVSIMGKSLGQTTVRAFDPASKLIRTIDVLVGYDLPAIRKALKEFLPYEAVGVEMVNTNIALTGQVSSISAADKAVKIVGEFVEPAYSLARTYEPAEKEFSTKMINLMSVTAGQQVMLRVRVGEMKRTAMKNLGINLQAVRTGADSAFSIATGGGIDAFVNGSSLPFGTHTVNLDGDGAPRGVVGGTYLNSSENGISGLLEALERDGLFKILAEPNLVAMSGEKAQFLAGGEFPVPLADTNGNITVEFKSFGVSVNFLPTVLSESRIRVQVEPEVSELSAAGAVTVGGITVPGISTRRAKTTVELSPGESFMIAGLLLDQMESTVDQLPGAGEIPILGALFRSTAYQREETELVLAITPYLVDPMLSGDVKLPTDEFKPASVMESFFYGALGSISDDAERISQTPSLEGPIGFMVD